MRIAQIIFISFILAIMIYTVLWVIGQMLSLLFKSIERRIIRNEYDGIIEELHGDYSRFDDIVIEHMKRAYRIKEDKTK